MNYKTVMTPNDFNSSFLALQSDQEKIWKKLFVESRPYSDILKRLLVINTPDCLDKSKAQYDKTIKEFSLKRLHDEEYIRLVPKLSSSDHEEVKSYIILEFDDFTPTDNPQFRDCTISFTICSFMFICSYILITDSVFRHRTSTIIRAGLPLSFRGRYLLQNVPDMYPVRHYRR